MEQKPFFNGNNIPLKNGSKIPLKDGIILPPLIFRQQFLKVVFNFAAVFYTCNAFID